MILKGIIASEFFKTGIICVCIMYVKMHVEIFFLDKQLPQHMNLHLAKLHNHVFIRAIYGFKVKVFHIISSIQVLLSSGPDGREGI